MAIQQMPDVQEMMRLVESTGLFDAQWYTQKYPDVQRRAMDPLQHYVTLGGRAQWQPGPKFDIGRYLKRHPELRYNRVPALVHYALNGEKSEQKPVLQGVPMSGAVGRALDDLRKDQWRFPVKDTSHAPRTITAVIPTAGRNMELLEKCIASLDEETQVVLVANGDRKQEVKAAYEGRPNTHVTVMEGTFNWSVANNIGAKRATTDVILFLNDDLYGPKGWDRELAARMGEEVRIAGPVIRHPSGGVQSAGTYRVPQGCTSAHITFKPVRPYYVEALMGAALMVRRDVFQATQFDTGYKLLMAETDYCMRVGMCAVFPEVEVIHHERTTRQAQEPQEDIQRFVQAHPIQVEKITYSPYALSRANRPLRVLILKLDHIGDAVMAERLLMESKVPMELFWCVNPIMEGYLKDRWGAEHVWSFLFFAEEASGGRVPFDENRWRSLVASMPPFDVVVDMRGHGETKGLLSAWDGTGTLTYAMGKDGYAPYNMMLEKIGVTYTQMLNGFIHSLPLVPYEKTGKGGKLVFCRGSSSPVKSWLADSWAELAAQLIRDGWGVVELDAPGMTPLEVEGLEHVSLKLWEISGWLQENATLYIGHDTGPSHIAALSGTPVVEIMGGLVQPEAWLGRGLSVSVGYPVSCSPCYQQPCKMGQPVCIKGVSVQAVLDTIKTLEKRGALCG